MKLSEINISEFKDSDIDKIVYDGIYDDNKEAKYALVFGNSILIKERVFTAVRLYNEKRVQKLIFSGGTGGVSNQDGDLKSEAEKMKDLALLLGVKEEDIYTEDKSNNSFENVDNVISKFGEDIKKSSNIIVVTSEFHLKRCYAILKQKMQNINVSLVAAKDGFSDRDNWYLSDNSWNSGRSLVTNEAGLLVKYAKEGKIKDLEVNLDDIKKI